MSEHRQILRGTTIELDAVTLTEGIRTYDTQRKELRVYDGVTLGGFRVPNLTTIDGLYALPDRLTIDGKLTPGADADSNIECGFYRVTGAEAHLPVANQGCIWVGASGDTVDGDVVQIYTRSTGTYMAERVRSNGVWSAWVRVIDQTFGDTRYLGIAAQAVDSALLNGQNAAFYTNIVARLGYTPLNKAGDVATSLTVAADPVVALGVVSKQYADAADGNRVRFDAAQTKTYTERSTARANVMAPFFRYLMGFTTGYINGTTMLINQGQCAAGTSTPTPVWTGPSLSKSVNAAWVAGNGGGMDITANIPVAGGPVYLYSIYDSTNNVADYCFSLNQTNPSTGPGTNIPATYIHARLIWVFAVAAGPVIPVYTQFGDTILLHAPVNLVNAGGLGTAAVLLDLGFASMPSGFSMLAKLAGYVRDATPTSGTNGYFSCPLTPDLVPGISNTQFNVGSSGGSEPESVPLALDIWTDTVRQIRYRLNQSQADITMVLNLYGWTWHRGENPV